MEKRETMQLVRSVERAARVAEALFLRTEGARLADLSSELKLHKTTVLRLLRTLISLGLVERDPLTDLYHFEPLRWVVMAWYMRRTLDRTDLVQEVLDELASRTGVSSALSVADFQRRRIITAGWSHPEAAIRVEIGGIRNVPMHTVAAGKVLLADMADEELEAWLRPPLAKLTAHTITDPQELKRQIQLAREQGYAINVQECALGVCGLAVPVRDARGRATGALSLALVGDRIPEEKLGEWLPLLRQGAHRVSQLLYQQSPSQDGQSASRASAALEQAQREAWSVPPGATQTRKVHRIV